MVFVLMVQMSVDEIIGIAPVQHEFMPAVRSVNMTGVVRPALVAGCSSITVCISYLQDVLVDMISVQVMEMAIMEIISMPAVPDRGVSATRSVDVIMSFLSFAGFRHLAPCYSK